MKRAVPTLNCPKMIVTRAPAELFMEHCSFLCRAVLVPRIKSIDLRDALSIQVGPQTVFMAPVILLYREYMSAFPNAPKRGADSVIPAVLTVLGHTGAANWMEAGRAWPGQQGIVSPPLVFPRKADVLIEMRRYKMDDSYGGMVQGAVTSWQRSKKTLGLVYLVGETTHDLV